MCRSFSLIRKIIVAGTWKEEGGVVRRQTWTLDVDPPESLGCLLFPPLASPLAPRPGVLHRILKPMTKSILVCIPIFLGDFGKNSLLGINNIRWGLFCQVVNRSLWMVCFQLMVMLSMCSYDPFLDVETEAQLNLLIFTQLAEDVSRWCSNPPVRPQCLLSSPPSHPQLFVCVLHGLDIYISVHHR